MLIVMWNGICQNNMVFPSFRATKVARISDIGNLFCFFIRHTFISVLRCSLHLCVYMVALGGDCFLNCQKATAAAAATLRESTWCDIGMRTT